MALTSSQAVLIDDFNSYVSGSYIQTQNPNWSRFGAATTDGIYSIAGGVNGTRGASYSVNFANNAVGSVRYTFATAQDFTATPTVSLDLSIPLSLVGTQVQAVLYSGTTVYQTTALSFTNASYQTYTFDLIQSNVTRTEGTASLADSLANVTGIALRFSNTNGTGTASINFDNLSVVPEPSTTTALALAAAGFGLYAFRGRRPAAVAKK